MAVDPFDKDDPSWNDDVWEWARHFVEARDHPWYEPVPWTIAETSPDHRLAKHPGLRATLDSTRQAFNKVITGIVSERTRDDLSILNWNPGADLPGTLIHFGSMSPFPLVVNSTRTVAETPEHDPTANDGSRRQLWDSAGSIFDSYFRAIGEAWKKWLDQAEGDARLFSQLRRLQDNRIATLRALQTQHAAVNHATDTFMRDIAPSSTPVNAKSAELTATNALDTALSRLLITLDTHMTTLSNIAAAIQTTNPHLTPPITHKPNLAIQTLHLTTALAASRKAA